MILYLYILVQVILESLPVSSSGHIALLELVLQHVGVSIEFAYTWVWDFLLHGPTIVILLVYFLRQWWNMIIQDKFSLQVFFKKSFWRAIVKPLLFIVVTDGITFVWWWQNLTVQLPLTIGFMITTGLLYSTRYMQGSQDCTWNLSHAVVLGLAQACSLMPGLSRFATTYSVGSFLGYRPIVSFAISFLIQIPLLVGACAKGLIAVGKNIQILQNLFDFAHLFVILSASLISYVVLSLVGISIKNGSFWKFSRYMVLPIMLSIVL